MSKGKSAFFKTTTLKQALRMGPRKFVKDYLFPAMRREHGNGFAMAVWKQDTNILSPIGLDHIYDREAPACHSVMCIGGTMQAILGVRSEKSLARVLGVPFDSEDGNDADSLFYKWHADNGPWLGLAKPFKRAITPREKEQVAEKAVVAAIRIGEKVRARQ